MINYLYIFFALMAVCQAQQISSGSCPSVSIKQNFDTSKFMGKWYEQAKYPNSFQGYSQRCGIVTYTMINETIMVVNTQLANLDLSPTTIIGSARLASRRGQGKLRISYPSTSLLTTQWILDTDYDSFSVLYSCSNFALYHIKYVWILTRSRFPFPNTISRAYSVLESNNLDRNNTVLVISDQIFCPLFW